MTDLALHATGIQHRYGKQQALVDIAFSLPTGTRCGLIGPGWRRQVEPAGFDRRG